MTRPLPGLIPALLGCRRIFSVENALEINYAWDMLGCFSLKNNVTFCAPQTNKNTVQDHHLNKIAASFVQRPWLAFCALLLFGAGVLLFEMRNLKGEGSFITMLATEKGNAFITIIENELRTPPGILRWTDNSLHALMGSLATDKDLHFLAIVDEEGTVLLGTGHLAQGERLWDTPPPPLLTGAEAILRGEPHFRVSRRIHLGEEAISPSTPQEYRKLASSKAPLWGVAGFSMKAISAARDTDRLHLFIIALVLLLLGLFWGASWHLVRRHLRSRQLLLETTAFSSHILRNLPLGIIATSTDYTITSINAEAARILAVPHPGSGEDAQLPAPRRLPPAWEPVMASLRSGVPLRDVEMRCTFAEGRSVPLSVTASPLATETGQQLGYVFIVRDLGEIRHLQAELRRRDRLAALGTLAAGIAHEVRNPLSAIRGIARYFRECHAANSEEEDMSKILEQEVLRLDKVVCNLLDLARPDTLQYTPVPLAALVEGARRMALPALTAHEVEFVTELPAHTPAIRVDGDRITQVFINLFLNAVDAMRESPHRRLTVRGTLEKDESGAWLMVEIEDTGCGIPPEIVQDIFSPYYTTKPRGTGLGLAIVHKIMEAHGGTIVARNSSLGGCIMALRLPLPPDHEA